MADRGPEIVYWIGAHKTGTNFLQDTLKTSAEHLSERGIYYDGRWDFRNKYTDPLLHSKTKPLSPAPVIPDDIGTVVFFDENLLGTSATALGRDGYYPNAVNRIRTVAEHLRMPPDRIILGIRSPDSFIRSAYGEAVLNGRLTNFNRYLVGGTAPAGRLARLEGTLRRRMGRPQVPPRRLAHLKWSELVSRLSREFGPRELVVYRHEQLRGNEARLLAVLFGLDPARLIMPQAQLRPSVFSQRAIAEVAKLAELHSGAKLLEVQELLRGVIETYPSGEKWPAFDPWSRREAAAFQGQYEADLSSLRSMPKVRLLDLAGS